MSQKGKITSDALLWRQLCEGNEAAFAKVYEEYFDLLIDYGCRFTKEEELIADAIQDIFLDIYRKRESLGKTDKIKPYLLKSLRRKLFRYLKRNYRFLSDNLGEDHLFPITLSVEEHTIETENHNERTEVLRECIDQLSVRQKEIIYLKYVDGLSYKEIAEVMNMNYQSVRNLMTRTIAKMRDLLASLILIVTLLS